MENGRTYHARIPIKIVTGELIPRVVLSSDPAKLRKVPEGKIRLRPIPGLRQPYYVFVENRTDKAAEVIVAVMEGSRIKARGGTKEMPIKVKAGGVGTGAELCRQSGSQGSRSLAQAYGADPNSGCVTRQPMT